MFSINNDHMRTSISVQLLAGRQASRRAGFTIVELLVVVGIILIVVGLLSAALNQTRARTLRVSCLDNMRQLQVGWIMYAAENNDHIALNKAAPLGDSIGIASAPRNSSNSWVMGNPKEDRS